MRRLDVFCRVVFSILLLRSGLIVAEVASVKLGSRFYSVLLEDNSKMYLSEESSPDPARVSIFSSPNAWIFGSIDRFIERYAPRDPVREKHKHEIDTLRRQALDFALMNLPSENGDRILGLRTKLKETRDQWATQYEAHQIALQEKSADQMHLVNVEKVRKRLSEFPRSEVTPEMVRAQSFYLNLSNRLGLKISDTRAYELQIARTYALNGELSAQYKVIEERLKTEEKNFQASIYVDSENSPNPFLIKIKELENLDRKRGGLAEECADFFADSTASGGIEKIRLVEKCLQNELLSIIILRNPDPVKNPYFQGLEKSGLKRSLQTPVRLARESAPAPAAPREPED